MYKNKVHTLTKWDIVKEDDVKISKTIIKPKVDDNDNRLTIYKGFGNINDQYGYKYGFDWICNKWNFKRTQYKIEITPIKFKKSRYPYKNVKLKFSSGINNVIKQKIIKVVK